MGNWNYIKDRVYPKPGSIVEIKFYQNKNIYSAKYDPSDNEHLNRFWLVIDNPSEELKVTDEDMVLEEDIEKWRYKE